MIKEFCDRCKKEELKDGKTALIIGGKKILLCPSCDKDFIEFMNKPTKKSQPSSSALVSLKDI